MSNRNMETNALEPLLAAQDVQQAYQRDVYLALSKWVSLSCVLLSLMYTLAASMNTHPWLLIVAFQFGIVAAFTFASPRLIKIYAFTHVVWAFLILATLVIFSFNLFQPVEFIPVGLMGSIIVIILSAFLEPVPRARFWAICHIAGYLIVIWLHSILVFPDVRLGILQNYVFYGTPFGAMIVIVALTQVTIQHFKSNLLVSEARREQLLSQREVLRNTVDELTRSNRELQDFAYVASHDLQEPLRKINTFGTRLNSMLEGSLGERERDYLTRMINAAERMQSLIQSLLTYSRVQTHVEPPQNVDLGNLIKGILSDLEVTVDQYHAQITYNRLPVLYAAENHMQQLFQNLIGNAIKYSKRDVPPIIHIESVEIPLSSSDTGTKVIQITVEDNGIGFNQQYAERIFGIFQRLHGHQDYEGAGIGLAICRKIVERYGGTIRAESVIDSGSKFIVQFPIKMKVEAPQ